MTRRENRFALDRKESDNGIKWDRIKVIYGDETKRKIFLEHAPRI